MKAEVKFENYIKTIPTDLLRDIPTDIYVSPSFIEYRDHNAVSLVKKEYDKEAYVGNSNKGQMLLAQLFRELDSSLNYAIICLIGCSKRLQEHFIPLGIPKHYLEKRYEMAEYLQKQHPFKEFSFKDELDAMSKELEELPYKDYTTRDTDNVTISATTSLSIFLGLTVLINKKYNAPAHWYTHPVMANDITLRDTTLGKFIEALLN